MTNRANKSALSMQDLQPGNMSKSEHDAPPSKLSHPATFPNFMPSIVSSLSPEEIFRRVSEVKDAPDKVFPLLPDYIISIDGHSTAPSNRESFLRSVKNLDHIMAANDYDGFNYESEARELGLRRDFDILEQSLSHLLTSYTMGGMIPLPYEMASRTVLTIFRSAPALVPAGPMIHVNLRSLEPDMMCRICYGTYQDGTSRTYWYIGHYIRADCSPEPTRREETPCCNRYSSKFSAHIHQV